MAKTIAEKCLNFIDAGVSCYHVIGRMKKFLIRLVFNSFPSGKSGIYNQAAVIMWSAADLPLWHSGYRRRR